MIADGAEIIGYVASVVIAFSMLMTSILKLRWYLLIGNILFVVYGIIILAYPVVLLNVFNSCVNIFFIYQAYALQGSFAVLHVDCHAPMLQRFIAFYTDDIHRYFPEFDRFHERDTIFMIIKGTAVIGFMGGHKNDAGDFCIEVDYISKTHRDQKPGGLLYHEEDIFRMLDTSMLIAKTNCRKHARYLKKMGFKLNNETGEYVLNEPA